MSKRVFESLEELKLFCDYSAQLPENIPKDCNVICFVHNFKEGLEFFQFYKESNEGLLSLEGDRWEDSSSSLYHEVEFDKLLTRDKYYYLRLNTKDVFTPERLLGVETTAGYIKDVNFTKGVKSEITTIQLNNGHWYCPPSLNFYISDDFDETVSLDEYIKLFYNVDNSL